MMVAQWAESEKRRDDGSHHNIIIIILILSLSLSLILIISTSLTSTSSTQCFRALGVCGRRAATPGAYWAVGGRRGVR